MKRLQPQKGLRRRLFYNKHTMASKSTIFKATSADCRHRPRLLRRPRLDPGAIPATDERMMVRLGGTGAERHQLRDICSGGTTGFWSGFVGPEDPRRVAHRLHREPSACGLKSVGRENPIAKAAQGRRRGAVLLRPPSRGVVARHRNQAHAPGQASGVAHSRHCSPGAGSLAQRSVRLQATIQEGVLTLGDSARSAGQ